MLTVYLLFIQGAGSAFLEQPSKYPTQQACEHVVATLTKAYKWNSAVCVKAEILK